MNRNYKQLHLVAGIVGAFVLVVDIWSNVEAIYAQTHSLLDSSIAAVIAVDLATAIALASAYHCARNWDLLTAAILSLGFIFGAMFSVTTTLDRVATQRDSSLQTKFLSNPLNDTLLKDIRRLENKMTAECLDGVGPKCKFLKSEIDGKYTLLNREKAKVDSLGIRIAAALVPIAIITPEAASLYQPMLLPVALFIFANILLAFALEGDKIPAEFTFAPKGRLAIDEKAKRYAEGFYTSNNRWPTVTEMAESLEVTPVVAKRLVKISKG